MKKDVKMKLGGEVFERVYEIQKEENNEEIQSIVDSVEFSDNEESEVEKMENIRLIADSIKIMLYKDETVKKFEQLEEIFRERYSSTSSLNSNM